MIEVVKIGSKSCGSCGKMTHYDEKVTRELGYEWRNLEKGTDAYKYATDILNEVRKFFGRSIGFPTYAIYEDGKLVHAFMGATDKGTFRRRLQRETLNSKAVKVNVIPVEEGGEECGEPGCPEGSKCVSGNRCEWVTVERNIIPACLQFQCCQNKCEDGRPDGNINIGDGDGDGLGDCDKRPTPDPVPGSNSKNQVYLYDRLNHTYIFCCPIKADVTWLLPFDTMPPVFQRYVTTTASVRVAAQMINNPQLFQLLKDRENTLRMECMNYEMEQADLNFLNQPDHSTYMSYQTMQTLNR